MPPKNFKNIKTPNDLRIILSRAINMLMLDQLDASVASSLSSLANAMLKTLQMTDLKSRIEKLEEQGKTEQDIYSPPVSDIQSKIKQLRN